MKMKLDLKNKKPSILHVRISAIIIIYTQC